MSRLEDVQEKYAKQKGYSEFFLLYCDSNYKETQKYIKEITSLYATECVKASLEKASENTKEWEGEICNLVFVTPESITNPENIVLL